MAIEFSIEKDDLAHALKPFFGRGGRGRSDSLDYVEIKAQKNEVEFVRADFVSTSTAEVASAGCARVAFALFETLFRKPQNLAWSTTGRISIRIADGQIQAGATTINHADVSIPLKPALPSGASLQDALVLSLKFSEQELTESGLWDKVKRAQEEAARIIGKAAKILYPLNITRESLQSFVWEQIVKPPERLKL